MLRLPSGCPWWGREVTGATECTLNGVCGNSPVSGRLRAAVRFMDIASFCCGQQRVARLHIYGGPKSTEHIVNRQRDEQWG